jgi:hypothetical protein
MAASADDLHKSVVELVKHIENLQTEIVNMKADITELKNATPKKVNLPETPTHTLPMLSDEYDVINNRRRRAHITHGNGSFIADFNHNSTH